MEKRKLEVSYETAKEWYHSDNKILKELALQIFTTKELNAFDFTQVKTLNDAISHLYSPISYKYYKIIDNIDKLEEISISAAALYKLNIVKEVLNTGYDMSLTKNASAQSRMWYPVFKFITKDCSYYNVALKEGAVTKLGQIDYNEAIYDVIYIGPFYYSENGLGNFNPDTKVFSPCASLGLIGCATKDIASYLGKTFWEFILEAIYGDLPGFKIAKT